MKREILGERAEEEGRDKEEGRGMERKRIRETEKERKMEKTETESALKKRGREDVNGKIEKDIQIYG